MRPLRYSIAGFFLLLILGATLAGCSKEPPPVPEECWNGRRVDDRKARSAVMFCVAGEAARKTVDSCKATGRVTLRGKDRLGVSFDAGTCDNGRATPAHRMTCTSAEGRSWACQFSAEAKLPGGWLFFPAAQGGK